MFLFVEADTVLLGGHSVVVACRAVSDLGGGGVGVVVAEYARIVVVGGAGAIMCTRLGFSEFLSWGRTEPKKT